MKIQFLFDNKTYTAKTRKVKTNSNYNLGLSIYDDKNVLLTGTIIKSTDNIRARALSLVVALKLTK